MLLWSCSKCPLAIYFTYGNCICFIVTWRGIISVWTMTTLIILRQLILNCCSWPGSGLKSSYIYPHISSSQYSYIGSGYCSCNHFQLRMWAVGRLDHLPQTWLVSRRASSDMSVLRSTVASSRIRSVGIVWHVELIHGLCPYSFHFCSFVPLSLVFCLKICVNCANLAPSVMTPLWLGSSSAPSYCFISTHICLEALSFCMSLEELESVFLP